MGLAGEPVVLECQPPRGHPEPTVSWSKDAEEVNVDGDRVKVLQDGNLMISQVPCQNHLGGEGAGVIW